MVGGSGDLEIGLSVDQVIGDSGEKLLSLCHPELAPSARERDLMIQANHRGRDQERIYFARLDQRCQTVS